MEEIFELHNVMFHDYTVRMQSIPRQKIFSRTVLEAMDYVEQHLQQPMKVEQIAEAIGKAPAYLSTLFKKETGEAVSAFIRRKRIESAKLLLQYTDYTCLEIAEYLCFSSESHFSRIFHDQTGETPRGYRKEHYRSHWTETSERK